MTHDISHFFILLFLATLVNFVEPRKILLEDIRTLTLRHGEMTTSRRSSPVPQLKCVGGTAGCYAFIPQHVQCYNRGSDGYDIQWECKTNMDTKYRFGKIDVTCEGYDYADDPYVLAGSCGLEYAMDLVQGSSSGSYMNSNYGHHQTSGFGSAVGFLCVIMIIFFIYRTCFSSDTNNTHSFQNHVPPPPSYEESFASNQYPRASAPPPPYGFRPEYQQQKPYQTTGSQNGNQPGFFSGMMAGGLLGYLFGNNRSSGYFNSHNYGYGHQRRDLFGNPGGFDNWSNSSQQTTSSGFGGTKRR